MMRAFALISLCFLASPGFAAESEAKAELKRLQTCQTEQDHACLFEAMEKLTEDADFAAQCRADTKATACSSVAMGLMFEGLNLIEQTPDAQDRLAVTDRFYAATAHLLPDIRSSATPYHLVAGEACVELGDLPCVQANAKIVEALTTEQGKRSFSYRVLSERGGNIDARIATFLSNAKDQDQ